MRQKEDCIIAAAREDFLASKYVCIYTIVAAAAPEHQHLNGLVSTEVNPVSSTSRQEIVQQRIRKTKQTQKFRSYRLYGIPESKARI